MRLVDDPDSAGYWSHIAEGRLALQRCQSCSQFQFPPLERCRYCEGQLIWTPVSGRGTLHTFIVQHHEVLADHVQSLPYVVALVAPDEARALRVPGRMTPADHRPRIGERVQAEIEKSAGAGAPPRLYFRPLEAGRV